MELRYCEECGDILEIENAGDGVPLEGFVCASCRGESAPSSSAQQQKSEQGSPNASLGSPGLDLFSDRSIAIHKKKRSDKAYNDQSLAERLEKEAADLAGGSEFDVDGTSASGWNAPDATNPNFTISLDDVEDDLVGDGAVADAGDSFGSPGGAAQSDIEMSVFDNVADGIVEGEEELVGSQMPASRAQKIVFRCPHCRSALCIRPVQSTSRLQCPSCSESVYVTISGQIFDRPPSVVMREKSQARQNTEDEHLSTKKMMSAGLKTSNPLDEEMLPESDGLGTHEAGAQAREERRRREEQLAPFRKHSASEHEGTDTFFITDGKHAAASLSDVDFDSRAVRKTQADRSNETARRVGGAGAVVTSEEEAETERESLLALSASSRGGQAHSGQSLVRKAADASKRRARTKPRGSAGGVVGPAIFWTLILALPIWVLATAGFVPALENPPVAAQAPNANESKPKSAPGSDQDTFPKQMGRVAVEGAVKLQAKVESLTE